ncbi:MAG: hypothetical protein QM651_10030, partial [Rhodoblastus sp.]
MVYRVDRIAESVSRDGPGFARPESAHVVDDRTPATTLEAQALASIGVPLSLIAEATAQARWTGASLDATLLASRRIDEDALYRALARRLGAPFIAQPVQLDSRMDYGAAAAAGVAALVQPAQARWLVA